MKFRQLKPKELSSKDCFIRKNRKYFPFEGESGFMAKNFKIKIFKKTR